MYDSKYSYFCGGWFAVVLPKSAILQILGLHVTTSEMK